jgi:hypothetical protein
MGIALAGLLAAATAAGARPPSMTSEQIALAGGQDECIRRGTAAMRKNSFTGNFEVVENTSIFGERGDYTALVRCAAASQIVFFVVAGPAGDVCDRYQDAIKDDF